MAEWEWVGRASPDAFGDGTYELDYDDDDFEALRAECGAVMAPLAFECAVATLEYCNGEGRYWDSTCSRLSTCGDGRVSYGETCDDGTAQCGNQIFKFTSI